MVPCTPGQLKDRLGQKMKDDRQHMEVESQELRLRMRMKETGNSGSIASKGMKPHGIGYPAGEL